MPGRFETTQKAGVAGENDRGRESRSVREVMGESGWTDTWLFIPYVLGSHWRSLSSHALM